MQKKSFCRSLLGGASAPQTKAHYAPSFAGAHTYMSQPGKPVWMRRDYEKRELRGIR